MISDCIPMGSSISSITLVKAPINQYKWEGVDKNVFKAPPSLPLQQRFLTDTNFCFWYFSIFISIDSDWTKFLILREKNPK